MIWIRLFSNFPTHEIFSRNLYINFLAFRNLYTGINKFMYNVIPSKNNTELNWNTHFECSALTLTIQQYAIPAIIGLIWGDIELGPPK